MAITPRVIGHIGSLGLLCILIVIISREGIRIPNKHVEWIFSITLILPLFHFFPIKCYRKIGLNARTIGHIAVLGHLCLLIYVFQSRNDSFVGIVEWSWVSFVLLSSFHFFSVTPQGIDDKPMSLVSWITSKTMWFSKLSHINILYFIVLLQLVAIPYFQIRISDNESNIWDNELYISDNESNISRIESNILPIESNISDNESNISDNESNISDNESHIWDNESRINTLEIYR